MLPTTPAAIVSPAPAPATNLGRPRPGGLYFETEHDWCLADPVLLDETGVDFDTLLPLFPLELAAGRPGRTIRDAAGRVVASEELVAVWKVLMPDGTVRVALQPNDGSEYGYADVLDHLADILDPAG